MADHIDIDFIFRADRENSPAERSLPWEETRDGDAVVVEPKPHWADDLRAFRLDAREYCYYADWSRSGARARFYGHTDTCGDDLLLKARAPIVREIAEGHWSSIIPVEFRFRQHPPSLRYRVGLISVSGLKHQSG